MDDRFQSIAVAEMSAELVRHVAQLEGDAKIKIAALRTAADAISQAVIAAGLTAVIAQALGPKN